MSFRKTIDLHKRWISELRTKNSDELRDLKEHLAIEIQRSYVWITSAEWKIVIIEQILEHREKETSYERKIHS